MKDPVRDGESRAIVLLLLWSTGCSILMKVAAVWVASAPPPIYYGVFE